MRISKAFALLAVCIFVLTSCSNYDYVSKEEQAYQEEISYESGFSDGIEFCATEYMALCYATDQLLEDENYHVIDELLETFSASHVFGDYVADAETGLYHYFMCGDFHKIEEIYQEDPQRIVILDVSAPKDDAEARGFEPCPECI